MLRKSFNVLGVCIASGVVSIVSAMTTSSTQVTVPGTENRTGYAYQAAGNQSIPTKSWVANHAGFHESASEKVAVTGDKAKAATDLVTVFRPVAPCRLVDTRGNGAPITGGAIATGITRTIAAGGVCGLPTAGVTGLSISFHAYNPNTALGSVIAMMPVGASTNGAMVGFHSGPMNWFMASANIKSSDNANFDVFVGGGATLDIIIDVNGYYQDMNSVDVGTTQLDYLGNGAGDVFGVSQSGAGNAIGASATTGSALIANASQTGNALRIGSGRFAISGSSTVNSTTTAAFIHTTNTTSTICSTNWSIIKHSSLDNNPNALILLTPRFNTVGAHAPNPASAVPQVGYYVGGCNSTSATTGHWYLWLGGTAVPNNVSYNVVVITQ